MQCTQFGILLAECCNNINFLWFAFFKFLRYIYDRKQNMMKKIKQLFLFLIPMLIVALAFIPFNQQDISAVDNSDSNVGYIRIETLTKHSNYDSPPLISSISGINITPVLVVVGNVLVFNFLLKYSDSLHSFKNRSPPINIIV